MPIVSFQYADRKLNLVNKKEIKEFVKEIFHQEKVPLNRLDYVFCSDEYLLQINRDFLQHDYYTDIITFDLSEGHETVGEVYISIDRVKENAIKEGEPFMREALRVVFHGALHLCGYKDKKKSELALMREKEDNYLRLFDKK